MGRRNLSELRWNGMSAVGTKPKFTIKGFRSAHRRIADVRASMSAHRCIPDVAPKGAEGRTLTRSRHSRPFNLELRTAESDPKRTSTALGAYVLQARNIRV